MKIGAKKSAKQESYDHLAIEKKWQKKWAASKIYKSKEDPKKDKYYVLDMFPYPSGDGLHVGHPKGYIATDVVSRMNRMQGKSVLHPMGFDAFGLPAENYALKTKTNPIDSVAKNVKRFKKQLEIIGLDYDWSREINTTDSAYYKWTQWIFLQLLKKGLAYESYEPINWCPVDKTGLANEDVENGRCERCGALVEKKLMRQWVLKITDYADRLLKDLDTKADSKSLLDWPESIKEAQRNWIGRSEGAEIDFKLKINNSKTRFVLIHGKHGTSKTDFIPWLKKELESGGHNVTALDLPDTEHPKETDQVEHVLKSCHFDENTVIVAHSLGSVVAMKSLMKMNKQISGLVLVAPAIDPSFDNSHPKDFWKTFTWDLDYEQIRRLTGGKIAILSDRNEGHRMPYLRHLARKLSARLIEVIAREKHFVSKIEPEILKAVTPSIKVFTTRPDTLFGATYMVLAPENPWLQEVLLKLSNRNEVSEYIARAKFETEIERTDMKKEKTGVELKGLKAINPANNEEIPVWIADYVLADYGTGAIMAVPAHDERDWEFAKRFNLPIRNVIAPVFGQPNKEASYVDGVAIVPFDPKRQLYGCLYWGDHNKYVLISGGREAGESYEDTARRELEEEAGFKDIKTWYGLGGLLYSHYFNSSKKAWKSASSKQFIAIIDSTTPVEPHREAHETFEVMWKSAEEILELFRKTIPASLHMPEILARAVYKMKESKLDTTTDISKFGFIKKVPFTESGVLTDSDQFSGKPSDSVKKDITDFVNGKWVTKYKLRDWVFSRQRYWGEPIPVIHCDKCGIVPVPEKDLPVKLPRVKSYEPTGTGESPLAAISNWVNVTCPKCKSKARRETNTMPQWAGSSWYYLRYEDVKNKKALVDPKKEKYWSPVDLYVGGAEHATRHLIYARFWHKFLYDIGVVSTIEPFIKLQSVGLIMGEDGRKMSKRFGNVVNPDDVIAQFGADTLRIYEMFMGPFNQQIAWSTDSIVGARRFIEKVWRLYEKIRDTSKDRTPSMGRGLEPAVASADPEKVVLSEDVIRILHKTIKKVTEDIQSLKFNTAISTLMIVVNEMEKAETISRQQFELLLQILAPFAPHVTDELWSRLGNKKSIHISEWPKYDPALIQDDEVRIVVQVNGKVRGSFMSSKDADNASLESTAKSLPEVQKWLDGKVIKKTVVVPGRLVSIVAE